MFGQLTNEEEQCIDNILTTGLDEINEVPSFALSSMSNQTMPLNDNSELNTSQNLLNEEKKEFINNSNKVNINNFNTEQNSKKNNDIPKNIIEDKNEKKNLSLSIHLSSSYPLCTKMVLE